MVTECAQITKECPKNFITNSQQISRGFHYKNLKRKNPTKNKQNFSQQIPKELLETFYEIAENSHTGFCWDSLWAVDISRIVSQQKPNRFWPGNLLGNWVGRAMSCGCARRPQNGSEGREKSRNHSSMTFVREGH